MLSFTNNIQKLDRDDARFQAVLSCLLSTISGIGEHALVISTELTEKFQLTLDEIQAAIKRSANLEVIQEKSAAVVSELELYKHEAEAVQSKHKEDLQLLFSALGEVAQTLSVHNDRHSSRLQHFTHQVQTISRGNDLSQMRRELTAYVAEMRAAQEAMWQDNSSALGPMREQLTQFQKRLEIAELRASTDALTGLLNRGEGEIQLQNSLTASHAISIMLIDLDSFKQINDKWGHNTGDQVLKDFSRALLRSVRPSDSVIRWGGDEFLVIVACDENSAQERAAKMRESLRFRHKLVVLGKLNEIPVSASIGATQIIPGDTASELLARADANLYKYKRNRPTTRGTVAISVK